MRTIYRKSLPQFIQTFPPGKTATIQYCTLPGNKYAKVKVSDAEELSIYQLPYDDDIEDQIIKRRAEAFAIRLAMAKIEHDPPTKV